MPSSAPVSTETLIDALTRGQLTVLPSALAARNLRHLYDSSQRAHNFAAWEPAPILSWSQFLDNLWSEAIVNGLETRLLLNQAQEHSLWLEAIASTAGESTLTSTDSLATLAAEAWALAHAYNAVSRLRATATTHDTRTFAAWAEAFTRLCDRNQYLSRAALESALQPHLEARTLTAPQSLTLAGFPDLTPAQSTLIESLRNAGTAITERSLSAEASPGSIRAVYTAPSEQAELTTIAHWLRDFLQQRPQARIAILLPTPDDIPALNSTFRQILAPELQAITADPSSAPWEIPSGNPLTAQPFITTALDLAQWAQSPLELGRVSALLLSPYLGSPDDRDRTAQFDAQVLRRARLLRPELDLTSLLRLAQTSTLAPAWLAPLHQFLARSANLDTPRTYADWAEFLRNLLTAAVFPANPDALTALEYHATQAWDALLDQLSTLDFRGRRIPYAAFLHTLNRQASSAVFAPPSTNAPIQVLSPSSAAGSTFDAIILARATDANYPPDERPNPLLSYALQSTLRMPGTSQSHSTDRAHQSLTSLLASAPNILVTYTSHTPDAAQRLAPSLAALDWPEYIPPQIGAATPPLKPTLTPDNHPLPPLPSLEVEGGARVLKLQGACGFLAFSELRLHSTELDAQLPGFDALESGNFLHRALHALWTEVRTQAKLREMSAADRENLIARCVNQAVSTKLRVETSWDAAYLDVQKERLRNVLRQWVDEELKRGSFEVIGLEQSADVTAGPLTFSVRIDRVDQLPGGGHLFVDYKTGSAANPSQWDDTRPEEPQLPLYSLLSQPGELKGVAFAKVRAGKTMGWLGYQADPGTLPMKRPKTVDLDLAIEAWRSTLDSLATDFANGVADVNPKDFAINCTRCAQRLLCRINPEAFLANEDADGDENGDAE
jgi:ATP-dependent helicase/nuclease subunit B